MSAKARAAQLTTTELHNLDAACKVIRAAFRDERIYLVGSAGIGAAGTYRDVDVRLMLDDGEFAEACPTLARWQLLCLAISAYLRDRTGLPVDFQIQRTAEANARFGDQPRNPLGTGRTFAGGGDATPQWEQA